MANLLKFEVGSMYENMKGIYEVVSIDDGSMVIRWKNGTEIETSVDLQSRIIERMTQEKEARLQKEVEKQDQTVKPKQKKSAGFAGFKERDFKNTSKDTVWRRRNNIGTAVAKGLLSEEEQFGSWAVSMRPEVHWMDVKRHNPKGPDYGIGFFVRVDDKGLYYGIYIQRSTTDGAEELEGWSPFKNWLTIKENENWLKKVAVDHNLSIYDASGKGFAHGINVHDETLELSYVDTNGKIESLSSLIKALSNAKQLELRVEKTMNKEEAVSRGKNIVNDISTLFNGLMPMYEMSTV